MFLRFLCGLAVLEIFEFHFNVFAKENFCEILSVKDTCADKVADLKGPQKMMAQIMWGFGAIEFNPHENTQKVFVQEAESQMSQIQKTKPEFDPNYAWLPLDLAPAVLTCANDRDVFPNTCSGYKDIEVFTKKALRQAQSEQMVHERALFDGLDPGMMWKQARLQMAKQVMIQGFQPSENLTMGMAWYSFSEYDAETKETKDVMKGVFSIGGGAGLCEKEYKINGTGCFGMQEASRPAVDPPKPPALPDTVQPPLPELKAKKPPGGSGVIIGIVVVVILLLIGAGGFFYVRQKKIEAAHGAREVELN